jgi:hypothetical protein
LAYSRAIELNRLQTRLATTVTEKEGAEALAAERRDKLPPVQRQLDDLPELKISACKAI